MRILFLIAGLCMVGCQSPPKGQPVSDTRVRRLNDDANELFAEGDVDAALKKYRAALRRAWATDDAYEAGTSAYNLAAALTSDGQSGAARDWLIDARHELSRAGSSAGNAWLLEAKIAIGEGRFADAEMALLQSRCVAPPCQADDKCGCPTEAGCKECCLTKLPGIGPKLQTKQALEDCRDGFDAQVHFTRARLAAEQYDVPAALAHFACGRELVGDICSHDLHAELHDVAAVIHLAKEEYFQAAKHFDREAFHLQAAGIYREIPGTLELAASAYVQAAMPIEAADRLNRVARVWLGRGDAKKAWTFVRDASELLDACVLDDEATIRVRLSLVAIEIQYDLSPSDGQEPGSLPKLDVRIAPLQFDPRV